MSKMCRNIITKLMQLCDLNYTKRKIPHWIPHRHLISCQCWQWNMQDKWMKFWGMLTLGNNLSKTLIGFHAKMYDPWWSAMCCCIPRLKAFPGAAIFLFDCITRKIFRICQVLSAIRETAENRSS